MYTGYSSTVNGITRVYSRDVSSPVPGPSDSLSLAEDGRGTRNGVEGRWDPGVVCVGTRSFEEVGTPEETDGARVPYVLLRNRLVWVLAPVPVPPSKGGIEEG